VHKTLVKGGNVGVLDSEIKVHRSKRGRQCGGEKGGKEGTKLSNGTAEIEVTERGCPTILTCKHEKEAEAKRGSRNT